MQHLDKPINEAVSVLRDDNLNKIVKNTDIKYIIRHVPQKSFSYIKLL